MSQGGLQKQVKAASQKILKPRTQASKILILQHVYNCDNEKILNNQTKKEKKRQFW